MKIFIVSLHRIATQSVHHMLSDAGFKCLHYANSFNEECLESKIKSRETDFSFVVDCLEPAINSYDVLSDVPIPAIYEELKNRYKDSLFIGLTRPVDSWIMSVRKHIRDERVFDPYEKSLYWKYLKNKPKSISRIKNDDLRYLFTRHYSDLDEFFKNSNTYFNGDLLDNNIGQKICKFIGIKERPLPHKDYFDELGWNHLPDVINMKLSDFD